MAHRVTDKGNYRTKFYLLISRSAEGIHVIHEGGRPIVLCPTDTTDLRPQIRSCIGNMGRDQFQIFNVARTAYCGFECPAATEVLHVFAPTFRHTLSPAPPFPERLNDIRTTRISGGRKTKKKKNSLEDNPAAQAKNKP